MRTFVQLKDGVGFAVVNTEGHTEGIEVDSGTGEQYLKKSYDNGAWSDAPLIWYAEVNYDGSIIEVKKTYFISEVGDNPIFNFDIKPTFRWVNNEWIDPDKVITVHSEPTILELSGSSETLAVEGNNNETGDTI